MIIDFTVENYRSIKEPMTLSAIAQRQRASQGNREGLKTDNEIAPPYLVEKRDFELLPVLAIFGANASGKSNVVTALDKLLTLLALGAGTNEENITPFIPFKLDATTSKVPTRFELQVLAGTTIYKYTLAVNQNRILSERLDYLPSEARRFRFLYHVEWDESRQSYVWENGADFSGPHKKLETSWLGMEPFLHVFQSQFASRPMQALAQWLEGYWNGISLGPDRIMDEHITALIGSSTPKTHREIVRFMQRFDTGISDIRIEWGAEDEDESNAGELEGESDDVTPNYEIVACHETPTGLVEWPFADESGGTRSLYPLVVKLLRAFELGGCMIVDELGPNMHPNLTHEIVRMFQSLVTNPKRAQLIFTTHDATIQSDQLLRRDQIWFTEKRADGSTNLYPLTDFKERNDRNIYRSYLDGRYGAVPILPPLETPDS